MLGCRVVVRLSFGWVGAEAWQRSDVRGFQSGVSVCPVVGLSSFWGRFWASCWVLRLWSSRVRASLSSGLLVVRVRAYLRMRIRLR